MFFDVVAAAVGAEAATAAAAAAPPPPDGSAQRDGWPYDPFSVDLVQCDSLMCKHNNSAR